MIIFGVPAATIALNATYLALGLTAYLALTTIVYFACALAMLKDPNKNASLTDVLKAIPMAIYLPIRIGYHYIFSKKTSEKEPSSSPLKGDAPQAIYNKSKKTKKQNVVEKKPENIVSSENACEKRTRTRKKK